MKYPLAQRTRLAGLALLIAIVGSSLVAAETADLRGYGKVAATIAPEHAEFVCANETKADILLGKLLADLFWDAGDKHVEKTDTVEGKQVLVHLWGPYGALIAGRDGKTVLVAGGRDEQEALAAAQKDRRFLTGSFQYKPTKPYPMYLDFYDLRAWKSSTPGLYPGNKYDNDARMKFVNEFCDGGLMGIISFRDCVAPGVNPQFSLSDTDMDTAEKNHQMYTASVSTGVWPGWAQNLWPELLEQDTPDSPASEFYGGAGPVQAMGIPPENLYESSLNFLKQFNDRYKDRNAYGGMELYCGDYGCETFFTKGRQGRFGYTAVGEEAFRSWLRDTCKYSLSDLGERWYGGAGHFKDWSEVQLPEDLDNFVGDLNCDSLRIKTNWFWMEADNGLGPLPDDTAPGWLPVAETPSREEYLTANPHGKPAYWRVGFDTADWLKKNAGKDAWLVCNIDNNGSKNYQVWLNGHALVQPESAVVQFGGPIVLKVTGLLTNGENRLALALPRGQIRGPVFLTTTKPEPYPYLGKNQNARYVDMLEWQVQAFDALVIDTMGYVRSFDPDRPFVIDPANMEVKDAQGGALTRFGGSMHDTGYESSFRSYDTRLGYAGGFYGSCEPAGYIPTKVPGNTPETHMLSQMLYNGDGHFRMTGDASYFYDIEKNSHWLETNRRDINLVGKTLPTKPAIAIFTSSQNALLGDGNNQVAVWSLGRGELDACHFDYVYVTESMLAKGMADDYPVLFDTNTQIMGEDTIDAIRKYVEKGGTFVALHQTGEHGILEPDTWPICQLTGFKVQSVGEKGKITFAKNLLLFKGWEGKEFDGEGSALDWKDVEYAKDVCPSLTPTAPDAVSLANWADGTTAVGMRPVGKGRVIVLGSTFWRSARDQGGTGFWRMQDVEKQFLERLLTDLGVQRDTTSSDTRVFTRKMITKNGLQDWLVVMNTTGDAIKADAGFAAAQKPAEICDLSEQKAVPFEYQNGWVTIKDVDIGPNGRRIFAAPRADLAGGLDFWWGEKTKFWKSAEQAPIVVAEKEDKSNPPAIGFDNWRFYADKDKSVGYTDDWAGPGFPDGTWRNLNNTPWNLQYDDLKDYSGAGLYRSRSFVIPAGWNGHRVSINIQSAWGGCYKKIEIYVNGTVIPGFLHPHHKVDITDRLKEDGNVVAVKLIGTMPLSGLLNCAIWIQPEVTLSPAMSLLGEWDALKADSLDPKKVSIPGVDLALTNEGYFFDEHHRRVEDESYVLSNHLAVKAWRLGRDIDIPADWKGKNVYARLNSPQMNTQELPLIGLFGGAFVINNHPISFTVGPNNPLDNETINLTPFIKFGQRNRIEIWPRTALQGSYNESLIVINNMDIGCEAK